jgi:ribonuclease VapC
MTEVVLDASAVIAVFKQEPGWHSVIPLLESGRMSAANFAEVATWLARLARPNHQVFAELDVLEVTVIDLDRRRAATVGVLEPKTRHRGLSLSDRACLALAIELGLPAVTADRAWRNLDIGVEIRLIR